MYRSVDAILPPGYTLEWSGQYDYMQRATERLLWARHYNMSVAVWVGIIALAGVDAETGVVMLLTWINPTSASKRKGACATRKISSWRSRMAP